MSKTTSHQSRRAFLKICASGAGAVGALAASSSTPLLAAGPEPRANGDKLSPLKLSGYKLDRVQALADGRVTVQGYDTSFEVAAIGDMNSDVFSGPQSREVTEIGLHPFMLAYANEGFRDYSLLPIFPLRLFRHKSIFIRTDRGIKKPSDLKGKRVGTPGFSSTSLTWLRGILQHEYGVKPSDIEWVVSQKDSSAKLAGKVSKQESVIPKGISVSKGSAGKDESELLESGDVDALLHAAEPRAYIEGHPKVTRLFSDYRTTERQYFKKTGIFPIMHAVAISNKAVKEDPSLPKAVFEAYVSAKKMMYQELRKLGWVSISLPWIGKELEETRALMGENFWPYGIGPNRKTLEALFQYSYEQGLSSKRLSIEELFEPSTLLFADS